ncbi:MAG: hypothetical protein WCI74_18510 [Actinomycetes bacterium]
MTELMSSRWLRACRQSSLKLSRSPFAVNIGCWDGKSFNDPVYPLFEAGFGGVAIEWGNPPELVENLGTFTNVRLMPDTYVTPYTICAVLADADCPATPDFLKIDIDGMDGDVLAAILRGGFRPLAMQVEVNPEIPPPYAFNVVASSEFLPGGATGFFGMSLQYACDLLSRFGYSLVELDFATEYTHDGLFVRDELIPALPGYSPLDPRKAFLEAPLILLRFPAVTREQKEAWRTRRDRHAVLQEIWDAALDAGHRKHGHTKAPFTLYLSHQSGGS